MCTVNCNWYVNKLLHTFQFFLHFVECVFVFAQQRGFKLREVLAHGNIQQPMPESMHLLPSTPQIKGLHTFIRNQETSRDEFIFYSNRLIRLVIEYALGLMPFKEVKVEAPQGHSYEGKRMACEKICGVSILRAGETMEQALCDVCKDIRIGKILIQTNQNTGEPEVSVVVALKRCPFCALLHFKIFIFISVLQLYYLRLPKDIKDCRVILMDATVATGAAAMMAIRVLLDYDVPEENIQLVSLLMAEIGVHSIAYAFPKVSAHSYCNLDPILTGFYHSLFGNRFKL